MVDRVDRVTIEQRKVRLNVLARLARAVELDIRVAVREWRRRGLNECHHVPVVAMLSMLLLRCNDIFVVPMCFFVVALFLVLEKKGKNIMFNVF